MRVTQSMLSNNMLRNLSSSYGKMSKLQDQITSGKKITRPSDDPVIAIKGMGYRTEIDKVKQFTRNIGEVHNWLDTTDATLGEAGDALNRVKELIVQAANDTNTADDREKIQAEINQIREQLQDLSNTQSGGKYIFSGTNTLSPLYTDVTYYDHNEIQKHYDNLTTSLKQAQDAKTAYTGTDPVVIADLDTAVNNAQTAFGDFNTARAASTAVPHPFETYLEVNNIKQKTARVLNAEYKDKDQNIINPFDSFRNMELVLAGSPPTKTTIELFPNPSEPKVTSPHNEVKIEVFDGIQLQVNTSGVNIFGQIDDFMAKVSEALKAGSDTNNATDISSLLGSSFNVNDPTAKGTDFANIHGSLLAARADVGAKQNRAELMENRLSLHEVNITKQMSQNEDVDYALAITEMTTQESIHQAALSVGAKIIQQTLVDFMR